MTRSIADRIGNLDWDTIRRAVDERGYALTPTILTAAECRALIVGFDDDRAYRSVVDMRRHRFGSGVYQYFDRPLPALVDELRTELYRPLVVLANEWATRLGTDSYPPRLPGFLDRCHALGQTRPTPLVFRYTRDDHNTLHQDVYGNVGFPLQALTLLSRSGADFTGGEFVLVTQVPRAQSVAEVTTPERGQLLIFPNATRPVHGTRGWYRANVRHGVSRVHDGTRHALGIIFHDAR
jgi:hypothetical protein